jgi:hypothetical protein
MSFSRKYMTSYFIIASPLSAVVYLRTLVCLLITACPLIIIIILLSFLSIFLSCILLKPIMIRI